MAYSSFYLRHWAVTMISNVVPWGLSNKSWIYNVVLRLLGAKIGKNVRIESIDKSIIKGAFDLLYIGHNTIITQGTRLYSIK